MSKSDERKDASDARAAVAAVAAIAAAVAAAQRRRRRLHGVSNSLRGVVEPVGSALSWSVVTSPTQRLGPTLSEQRNKATTTTTTTIVQVIAYIATLGG